MKAYEEGIFDGALSALARQHGDGIINLTVGNIRPGETVTIHLEIIAGVELRDDGFRFRFPFTLAPAYHGRARVALAAPGEGEMELPSDEFGDVILPRFREDASALHQVGFDLAVSAALEINEIGSPSHAIRLQRAHGGESRVMLAQEKDIPDRDLVLDARLAQIAPQILAGRDKQGLGRFATVIPSTCFGVQSEAPRRIAILLDRSGSMNGAPIEQAKRAIEACLAVLSEADSFGLVAFDNVAESFETRVVAASLANRDRARAFLSAINARGGTDLVQGVKKSAEQLEGAGGDVFIFTDGQVSGTEAILAQARSTGTRLHCLGIGSASQDRFLSLLARETGGVSRFVTPRERVDMAALDLFASVGRPIATGLCADGNVQPQPPGVVFSGTPVLLFGEAAADTDLNVSWDGGNALSLPVSFNGNGIGDTLWLLQGSRLITDWEIRYPVEAAINVLERRKTNRVTMRLRHLSEAYGLASREMSLVAVVRRAGDQPGELPHTRVVPVGMPQDTMFDGYFADSVQFSLSRVYAGALPQATKPPLAYRPAVETMHVFRNALGWFAHKVPSIDDQLTSLAARIEPDGGIPGTDLETRVAASIAALFAFLQHGHTPSSGAFRAHVARLVAFVESASGFKANREMLAKEAIARVRKGEVPAGNWLKLANKPGWDAIERALAARSVNGVRGASVNSRPGSI